MPHHPELSPPSAGPVPAAVLLPATSRRARLRAGRLSVEATCRLVATYARVGDAVVDLDSDPHTTAAVHWLDRKLRPVEADNPTRPTATAPARLVIARLPRRGVRGLAATSGWMRHLRDYLLTPGGYLLTIVSPTRRGGRYHDHATTVIAAAKAAGLSWQQQLLHIRTPLPEPDPAAGLWATTRQAYLRIAGLVVEPGGGGQWFSQPPAAGPGARA